MILRQEGFEVLEASSARSALQMLEVHDVDVVLSDVRLPDGFGVDLVTQYKAKKPHCEVILMTAYGNIPDGVQAMKNGAYDYIVKGDDNDKIIPLVYRALEKVKANRKDQNNIQKSSGTVEIIGNSPAIQSAKRLAEKVAVTDATVLLTGETGTGKEVFAHVIHQKSPRSKGNFVALNCSAFSKDLLESELFGHKKGAFTGAVSDKKGLVEEAANGTLFLDEIGEMPLELQAKLLRLLENGEYIKMGETKTSHSNFRLIAATNRDLKQEISRGNFREDLYFRLNIFEIHLPPLRDRLEDVPLLAKDFILKFSAAMHLNTVQVEDNYLEKLKTSDWKGNIRELKNAIERSMILMEGSTLSAEQLMIEATGQPNSLAISAVEKQHIIKVLNYTKGNKSEAARLLGIGIATLYRKLEEYGLK
ncbi:sigma-54-dependent transcriptional regulator [Chryseobacterium taklimakanense]|uniref:Sigma-54-dependent Fis family transcriptional regulator n=1 Tax=Chryseobacterium taklimakanense TaxID=536441 RepID=A0A3G8WTD3_9FLAO|nr:sigma-54 dependent transcriptional regulator [Chryseobacterium taklimakanense]AZI21444.1 sigma-54-dependent Fis family transcriptional regulator [Chryseobacterium taklimakanense]